MESIELTAKTVEEATALAAEKFGVSPDKVTITVLEQTKGLFGKINLRVKAETASVTPAAAKEEPATTEAKPKRGTKAKTKTEETATVDSDDSPAAEASAEAPAPEKPGRIGASRKAKPAAVTAEAKPADASTEEAPATESPVEEKPDVVATQADADQLQGLIDGILSSSGLVVTLKQTELNGRYVNFAMDGNDAAHLVGKHGEVLNQFQYLLNIIASRKIGNGVRITLDGNDYRTRREEALTQLAEGIAEQVRLRKEEAVLDALPAFERRIVHKALSELEGVVTYSEGEEPNRRVVIAPAE